jgi:hypothetical protein
MGDKTILGIPGMIVEWQSRPQTRDSMDLIRCARLFNQLSELLTSPFRVHRGTLFTGCGQRYLALS